MNYDPENIKAIKTVLGKLFTCLEGYFAIEDYAQYWIVLGMAAAHYIPGEPLWMRVIGPSRAGKTELLRAFSDHPDIAKLENVTVAAIRGGLDGGNRVLPRLNGKLVITKEMAQIHCMRKDARREIMGVLRGVKDGEIVSDFGTKGNDAHLEQKVTFDWLCATTKAGSQDRQMDDLLGARFLDLTYIAGEREAATERAILNVTLSGDGTKEVRTKLDQARSYMQVCIGALLSRVKALAEEAPPALPKKLIGDIVLLANVASWLRTPVAHDARHQAKDTPDREAGTEIGQGLSRLARGLLLLGVKNPLPYLARVAHDSISDVRQRVLRRLLAGDTGLREIARKLALPPSTVELVLDDLHILAVISRRMEQAGAVETVSFHLNGDPGGALKELFRLYDKGGVHEKP